MKLRVAAKLDLLIICIVTVLCSFLGWFFIRHETGALIVESEKRASTITNSFAYNCEYGILVGDKDNLQRLVENLKKETDVVYAVVKDLKGTVLIKSTGTANGDTREFSSQVFSKTMAKPKGEYADIFENIPVKEEAIGSVHVGFALSDLQRKIERVRFVIMLLIFLTSVFSLLIAHWIIKYFIEHSLSPLVSGIKKFTEGNLEHRIQMKGADEIAELGILFNTMAARLADTLVSKAYVDDVIDSMMDCLIVTETEGLIITINNAALNMLGYNKTELLGKSAGMLFENSILSRYILARKNGVNIETTIVSKFGKIIPVLFSCSVMNDKTGTPHRIVCNAKDITERKKTENALRMYNKQLKMSNRNLEDFAYIASHDLQEPLRKVKAFSDLIKSKYESLIDEKGLDYIDRMQKATERMQLLIDSLLSYSRISTKAQAFVLIDLNKVISEVLTDLEIRLNDTGGRVEVGKLTQIEADPVQMRQLFQNLIGNALKFHKPDVSPVIKVYEENIQRPHEHLDNYSDYTRIIVEDNGIGFDEKYSEKIFAIFQRLHTREEYEGTGIGLAVCRKIMDRHNGSITAQSTPGQGSQFVLTIPLKQTNEEELHAEEREKANSDSDS
ncbi:MAG TPA: hypothetical protein DEE98_01315 [Elusimicrobia bacterium]|nr:MAG: hypothetical protein A2278_08495 [Elusimicrobia bacterium RIFOXYA12_FULL_49_49]OGS06377.1 MAG: hypothetical protein A2204_02660 [Elusimicrobia bacterium RIFOXYA1_FULL_47_7]OGS10431.1 MAG: hypothetical protein A2386_07035 [Elusimicrobia bacterium RIFOXYB1_FULL_48_9]OGS15897.1 MAG: hypothetical protein A2251_01770 [Elusimicrobia bacterium RIFOXYA2_FULL_47_53]OGS26421.1 MAG: hypothetical protein A2339_03500 [Elusimicrobia bacterium RIFOXYB12_FULL_50_12]OGS29065.1 MAG: hypothetical protein